MKNKLILLLVLLLNINYFCFSQTQDRSNNKAEVAQIAYITKELALTPDEAQKFWPLYNSYKNEIKSARKDNDNDQLELEEKVLNTRKKYKNDFKKVLGSDERVNKLFVAEKDFRAILRKELEKRQQERQKP